MMPLLMAVLPPATTVRNGPWFHGGDNFRGHVNNSFHPEHGYKGTTPQRGEKFEPSKHADNMAHFKGNEVRDGRGHTGEGKR
jgi:hypothetical protein